MKRHDAREVTVFAERDGILPFGCYELGVHLHKCPSRATSL